ncbi:MAG: hypothetical protein EAX86_10085 [Candidatus Heimdallarchaeota archaeon]|nr:hypothetical protein [Candidatus Heimdallarchaeota archaeon]
MTNKDNLLFIFSLFLSLITIIAFFVFQFPFLFFILLFPPFLFRKTQKKQQLLICEECQSILNPNWKLCPYCGRKVEGYMKRG